MASLEFQSAAARAILVRIGFRQRILQFFVLGFQDAHHLVGEAPLLQ